MESFRKNLDFGLKFSYIKLHYGKIDLHNAVSSKKIMQETVLHYASFPEFLALALHCILEIYKLGNTNKTFEKHNKIYLLTIFLICHLPRTEIWISTVLHTTRSPRFSTLLDLHGSPYYSISTVLHGSARNRHCRPKPTRRGVICAILYFGRGAKGVGAAAVPFWQRARCHYPWRRRGATRGATGTVLA